MYSELSKEQLDNALRLFVQPCMYVYYDEFNNVTAISNLNTLGGNFIEVPQYRTDEFLSNGKDFNKYKIDYFKTDAPIKEENENLVYHILYMIPVLNKNLEKELVIAHNKNKKTWKFFLNNEAKQQLDAGNRDKTFTFYVTQYRNPHFLLSTINVSGDELISGKEIKFKINDEKNLSKISLYTSPNFSSYGIVENDTSN